MMRLLSAKFVTFEQPQFDCAQFVAPAALLAAGLLLAVTTNLAKVVQGFGVSPLAYLTWSLAGAALLLAIVSFKRGEVTRLNRASVKYYAISGFLTVAGSNLIFFTAINHLGVSFVALMLSLPPLLTYTGALILRMESFCSWRASGVVFALIGTLVLVISRWAAPDSHAFWIVVTLIAPVLLSAGNLYRTSHWPVGASAESLAPGMLLGAIVTLVVFSLLPGWSLRIPMENLHAVSLIIVQSVVFAGQFLMLFVLQKHGGPVFLSLMGAVSAIFSVPVAMFLLSEPALPGIVPSAALIAVGIACMLLGVKACQPR